MRIARAIIWVYPAFVLAIGLGFLVWSYFQAADADAYRNASQCGNTVTPNCYETFPGIITSVHVGQSRSGERDDVDIKTEAAGNLTATLEPSASAAPHVHTGANVTVKPQDPPARPESPLGKLLSFNRAAQNQKSSGAQ